MDRTRGALRSSRDAAEQFLANPRWVDGKNKLGIEAGTRSGCFRSRQPLRQKSTLYGVAFTRAKLEANEVCELREVTGKCVATLVAVSDTVE